MFEVVTEKLSAKSTWLLWALAMTVSLAIYSFTLTLTKHIWQDEVQILEWGRALLNGSSAQQSSMVWSPDTGRPTVVLYYLGPLVQEISYRLFGSGCVGPRISAIAGAVFASGALLWWLLNCGARRWLALGCSFLFFWDPLFVEGYRGARIDSWTMGFMLMALGLIAVGRKTPSSKYGLAGWQISSAFFIGLAGVFWASAVLLLPLVIYECLRSDTGTFPEKTGRRVAGLCWLGLFSFVCLVLLLGPILPKLVDMVGDSAGLVEERVESALKVAGFFTSWTRSPWLPICAVAIMIWCRSWGLLVATAACAFIVLLTGAYIHRAVYLLPYFALALSLAQCRVERAFRWSDELMARYSAVIVLMLFWSAAISLGARTFVALSQKESRDPRSLTIMLAEQVGEGSRKAYLADYDTYYAARSLGWHVYKTVLPEKWTNQKLLNLLQGMDLLLIREDTASGPDRNRMEQMGFRARVIATGSPTRQRENYGEYMLYERR